MYIMHCFNYVSAFSELDESLTSQLGSTPAAQPQSPCSLMEVPSPSSYPNSLTQQHLLVHEDNTLIDACSGNVHNMKLHTARLHINKLCMDVTENHSDG